MISVNSTVITSFVVAFITVFWFIFTVFVVSAFGVHLCFSFFLFGKENRIKARIIPIAKKGKSKILAMMWRFIRLSPYWFCRGIFLFATQFLYRFQFSNGCTQSRLQLCIDWGVLLHNRFWLLMLDCTCFFRHRVFGTCMIGCKILGRWLRFLCFVELSLFHLQVWAANTVNACGHA